jgi:methionine synthase II (cobalamin-independent)
MGITIKELKEFLSILPEHMDEFEMVNGEVSSLTETGYYVRIDKPIIHLEIDEKTNEFLLLHQSEEEINKIIEDVKNGDSEED